MNIHQLAFHGQIEKIRTVLASTPDSVNQFIHLQGHDKVHRITPIFLAAIQGHLDIVKLFLEKGANVEWQNETERLMDWVDHSRDFKRIEVVSLLSKVMKTDELNSHVESIDVFKKVDSNIRTLLVSHFSAEIKACDDRDYYVLLGERGDLKSIEGLLSSSEDVLQALLEGALRSSRIEVLRLFIQSKLDMSVPFKQGIYDGNTPALFAAGKSNLEVIKFLRDNGVDLLSPLTQGRYTGVTPVYVAASGDQVENLKFLHDLGANIEEPLKSGGHAGKTLAYAAAMKGSVKVLQYLHQAHVNVNQPLEDGSCLGETPVFNAASNGHRNVLEFFHGIHVPLDEPLQKGVYAGATPAYIATIQHKGDVLEFLYDAGVNLSAPHTFGNYKGLTIAYAALFHDDGELIRFLHARRINLNQPVPTGGSKMETPAFIAARIGKVDALRVLFEVGVDPLEPLMEGEFKGVTLAYFAAFHGRVDVLKLLHERKISLSDPLKSGKFLGTTPAFVAASFNKSEVIEYLGSVGVNLSESLKATDRLGDTCAFVASTQGFVEVLKVLKKYNVDLTQKKAEGRSKGIDILFNAALINNREVLEYLKSEGLFHWSSPPNTDKMSRVTAFKNFRAVQPLTDRESAVLLRRKLEEDPDWFYVYRKAFFQFIDVIPISVWVDVCSWNELKKIDQLYQDQGGERKDWLLAIAIESINNSKEDLKVQEMFSFRSINSIENLKAVIRPGQPLIQLLQRVIDSDSILNNSNLRQLNEWINGVLKQTLNDEECWTRAKSLFEEIHDRIKAKPSKKLSRGKGKGKQKPAQDSFKKLWLHFDQKIQDSTTPQEELHRTLHRKIQESESFFEEWIKQLDLQHTLIIKQIDPSQSSTKGIEQALIGFNDKVNQLFSNLKQELAIITKGCIRQQNSCADIKQQSKLIENLDAIHVGNMEKAREMHGTFLTEVARLEAELKKTVENLQLKRDFKIQKKIMADEVFQTYLSEVEKLKNSLIEKGNKLMTESQNQANAATTNLQLNSIREEFQMKLQELMRLGGYSQTEMQARSQRSQEYFSTRNELLKKENKKLTKQIELLEKKLSERPRSPDKIIPIIEKSNRDVLIEKLRPLAAISKRFKRALDMIEVEGKILSSVGDMVKFLALFKIEWAHTVGSHKKFSDQKLNVLISNHDRESKPEEIEEVLKAVLSKLS